MDALIASIVRKLYVNKKDLPAVVIRVNEFIAAVTAFVLNSMITTSKE